VKALVEQAFANVAATGSSTNDVPPAVVPAVQVRHKDLEQSHVCLGTPGLPQNHADRYVGHALNTVLGGSMSSRLFQNVRERRGLAYSVFSSMSAYQDAGALSIYAGCGNEVVSELIGVVVAEIRRMRNEPIPDDELRRAKDHLKGSLMLNLESTSSRMSHHARQEIYRDREDSLDEMLESIERVTADDVQRLAGELFARDGLSATVLGSVNGLQLTREQLRID
jgi:predicted Zn-dependent peptidase